METKHAPTNEVNKKRSFHFNMGLVVALALTLIAFEWTIYSVEIPDSDGGTSEIFDIESDIPIIVVEKPQKPIPQIKLEPKVDITLPPEIITEEPKIIEELDFPDPIDEPDFVQSQEPEVDNEVHPFYAIEEEPKFVGGDEAYFTFLKNNIRYPKRALKEEISGTVYISFVVEKDGSISNVSLAKGIGGGCDEEAMRVISSMPKWKPGKQREKAVRVQCNARITFTKKG